MYNTPLGPLVAIIKAVTYCNILQHIHSVFGIKRSHAKDRNIFVHVLLYVAFAKSCANSPRFGIRFILINQILLRALYQTSGNFCNPLQHTATHCNTFQHTATCCPAIWNSLRSRLTVGCNTLDQTALDCNLRSARTGLHDHTDCNTLQHNATHCSKLQHTATH